ncbi:MFS transporter [Sphaerisporangium aureirubrum]|uniref:MFS transporter n=1 Tax=Sphaerisporangium aureirubrum TaxID=1544736 RepID=A0ABW1NT14_9ACTN
MKTSATRLRLGTHRPGRWARTPANRDLRLYWGGQTATAFGSVFTAIAVPLVAVHALGASPAETGLLAAAASLPLPLFGLFISAWADRLRTRRRVLIGCDLAIAGVLAATLAAVAADVLGVWTLAAVVFLVATAGVMVETVYMVHLKSIVAPAGLVTARARLNRGEYIGGTLGRALAGPAAALGLAVPFLVDLLARLLSAVTLMLIRSPETPTAPAPNPEGRRLPRDLGAGFRLLATQPFLRGLVPFLAGQQVVAGMTLALVAPFLLNVLGVPAGWYGLLFVLLGVSGVAGTFLSELLSRRLDPERLTLLGLLGAALGTAALPLAGGPLTAAAAVAALGIGLPHLFAAMANIGLVTFVTLRVPDEVLGRVSVSVQLVTAAGATAGALLGGLLGTALGVRPALWAAFALSALSLPLLVPVLRLMRAGDRPDVPAPV